MCGGRGHLGHLLPSPRFFWKPKVTLKLKSKFKKRFLKETTHVGVYMNNHAWLG